GGSSPAAIWRGFMEAALPRLAVQPIPNGPPLPEGWIPPDPVGDLMGQVEDPYAAAAPYDDAPPPVIIDGQAPQAAQPQQPPATRPAPPQTPPAPQQERRPDALFF